MTTTEPKIDALTGTVIVEPDTSADGGVTPSLLATEPQAPASQPDLRQERLAALVAEGAEVYALIYDAVVRSSELVGSEDALGENLYADRYRVVNAAFAYWLGVTV